jgi:uncharacterized protein
VIIADEAKPAKPTKRRRTWRQWLLRLVYSGVVIYVGVAAGGCVIQDWLIFPGHWRQGSATTAITASSDEAVVRLKTADGTPVVGWYGKAWRDAAPRAGAHARLPTVIYFYGNAMSASDAIDEFHQLRRLGLNVMVAEYAGFGQSGGEPSEVSLYATADAMYDYLLTRDDVDRDRIVPMGWSLGAAVATDLASRRPVAGLAIFSAFTSMPDIAQQMLPWLPARWIVRYRFDNAGKFPGLRCPIFLAHGLHDTIIPHAMSDVLAAAAPKGRLTRLDVDSDHNDLFEIGGGDIWPALGRWLRENKITGQAAGN